MYLFTELNFVRESGHLWITFILLWLVFHLFLKQVASTHFYRFSWAPLLRWGIFWCPLSARVLNKVSLLWLVETIYSPVWALGIVPIIASYSPFFPQPLFFASQQEHCSIWESPPVPQSRKCLQTESWNCNSAYVVYLLSGITARFQKFSYILFSFLIVYSRRHV